MGEKCECDALALLRKMALSYSVWVTNMELGNKLLHSNVHDSMKHIKERLDDRSYRVGEARGQIDSQMSKIETKIADAEHTGKWMMPADQIKDSIHRFVAFRSMFLCGSPISREEEQLPVSEKVRQAIHVWGEDSDEAEVMLRTIMKEIRCPGAEHI